MEKLYCEVVLGKKKSGVWYRGEELSRVIMNNDNRLVGCLKCLVFKYVF